MSDLRAAFDFQSKACVELGSPFMGRLMALCAARLESGSTVADHLFGWPQDPHPSASSLPLRLAGALHALVLGGHRELGEVYPPNDATDDALWSAVASAFETEAEEILVMLESPPQTNEVRRAAGISCGLHMVAARFGLPLDLLELGTSAGLNLRADRFAVETATHRLGPPDAAVALRPVWTGPAPHPAQLDVALRMGVDLSPIDPADRAGERRLLSYLWPDQPERLGLTRAAIAEARANPAEIATGDAGDWLTEKLAGRPPDRATVVFHTVAWQYFSDGTKAKARVALEAAGAMATDAAPLARISMEADGGRGAVLALTTWPGGTALPLARVDFHGRWVDWTGPTVVAR